MKSFLCISIQSLTKLQEFIWIDQSILIEFTTFNKALIKIHVVRELISKVAIKTLTLDMRFVL